MPLTNNDRAFLRTVDRLKLYLVLIAAAIFVYLLLIPPGEKQMTTSVLGVALCGIFWLTSRLLSFITTLDTELTRVVNAVKRSLTDAQRRELFPD